MIKRIEVCRPGFVDVNVKGDRDRIPQQADLEISSQLHRSPGQRDYWPCFLVGMGISECHGRREMKLETPQCHCLRN